jgi:uncharacterized protein (TIGR02271 family)
MPTTTQPDSTAIVAGTHLVDSDGERAEILSIDHAGPQPTAMVRTEQGRTVRVATDMLQRSDDGSCRLAFSLALLEEEPVSDTPAADAMESDRIVIPVYEEQLQVDRRTIDTGSGVRVRKSVSQREEVVDVPLECDELEVVRIPVDRTLAAGEHAVARHEGDTLIVPVLEEVLVVEKRWRLKEEVRITRHRREAHAAHRVVLRSETVTAERFNENDSGLPDSNT